MTTLVNGLLGGAVAGLVAALAAWRWTRAATASDSHRSAASRIAVGATLVSYGALAGGALLAVVLFGFGGLGVPPTTAEAFLVPLAWSALLAAVALAALGASGRTDRSTLVGGLVYHLAYGIALGAWIRVTWIT